MRITGGYQVIDSLTKLESFWCQETQQFNQENEN